MAELPKGFVLDKAPSSAGGGSLPAGFVPDRNAAQNRKFDDIDLETQTLYDMAKTPREKRRALEHGYGIDAVKTDDKGFYIEQEGKYFRPAGSAFHNATAMTAELLSDAAPTVGAIGGAMLGAPAGPAGAVAGAGLGGMAGQSFNDTMLSLAGVYDRSYGQQAKELGTTGAYSAMGEQAGQIIGKGIAGAAQGVKSAPGALRKLGRWALGVDAEEIKRAKFLADQGINVPPESYAKEAPILPIVRSWAKRYGYDPVAKTAKKYYEEGASTVLRQLGVPEHEIGKLTEPTSAVSYKETGDALIKKAQQKMAEDDAKLDAAVASMRSGSQRGMDTARETHQKLIDDTAKLEAASRASAQKLIDTGWEDIGKTESKMWDAAKLGEQPGNLARQYASQIWNLRRAISRRARTMYDTADAMAGGGQVDTTKFKTTAVEFLDQLPEDLQKQYPGLVNTISEMQNRAMTFGEARNLRSILRDMSNYEDLTPTFKNGIFKRLSGELNATIHAPGNQPKVQKAASLLDDADAFYSKEMARFKDQKIRMLGKQAKSATPPNPDEVAKTVLDGGSKERADEIRKIVGPDLWNASVAADINRMIRENQTLVPGVIDTKGFVSDVTNRMRTGVFDSYPDAVKNLILDHARRLSAMDGKLEVPLLKDDDFKTFLTRANDMAKRVEELSKINPVETLQAELKTQEKAMADARRNMDEKRAADQLKFLAEPTALAEASAKKIVSNPDLLRAALLRFDAGGPEVQMLRQTAARDMLTMGIEHGGNLMKRLTEDGMTPEVQKLLFPGGLDKEVIRLASDMKVLFPEGSDMYANLSGGAAVTHPEGKFPKGMRPAISVLPGFMKRMILGKALGSAANIMTSPQLVKFLAGELDHGPAGEETVRRAIQETVDLGGKIGNLTGSLTGQAVTSPPDERSFQARRTYDWRKDYAAGHGRHAHRP